MGSLEGTLGMGSLEGTLGMGSLEETLGVGSPEGTLRVGSLERTLGVGHLEGTLGVEGALVWVLITLKIWSKGLLTFLLCLTYLFLTSLCPLRKYYVRNLNRVSKVLN